MRSFAFAFLLTASTSLALRADPPIPADGLYKPTFLLLNDSWSAGTAFLVNVPGHPGVLLVTCNHLFGPDGGLQSQMSPDEIATNVHGVIGLSMQKKNLILIAPTYLKIADAGSIEDNQPGRDLALFTVANSTSDIPLTVFKFADTLPANGERVWVYARLRGSDEPRLFPATIVADKAYFKYVFDDLNIKLAGTSGAPVLNEKGLVVGMNLGGGTTSDQKAYGIANPVTAILPEIATALKSLPAKP